MIKIIEPQHYIPQSERQIQDSSSFDLSQYEQVDSQHSSDDGMEVQIVNTEEIANQKVYKFCNRSLILLTTFLLVAYFIEMQKPLVVEIGGAKLIELPTIYTTVVQNNIHEVTIFVPDQAVYHDQLTEKVAQKCSQNQVKDCWRETLVLRRYMFLQGEKWPIKHMLSDNILVFWQERLALSILMLALNVQNNQRIDIVITAQHKRDYIESLKINLNKYEVSKRVQFIYMQTIESSFLSRYSLVIGNHRIFDEIVYPQLMEQAVLSGFQLSTPSFIYQFISKTNLLLFFDDQLSELMIEQLQIIHNQIINVSISKEGNEIIEENVKDLKQRLYVIALDERMKPADQIKKKKQKQQQIIQLQVPQDPQPVQAQIQNPLPMQAFETIQPLKYVPRIKPQRIRSFFQCRQNNRQFVKNGQFYYTQFHDIKLIKEERESLYLKQSHFYNFVIHLLIASIPCNVLDIIQDQMLASIIAALKQGEIFVPEDNNNLPGIKQTVQYNNLQIKTIQHFLGMNMLQNLVKGNLIKISFVTMSFFQSMYDQLISLLKNDMNIVMKMTGTQSQKKMLQQLMDRFYIFVVSQDRQKKYSASCVSNYQVEYYEERQYPQHSYLFISRQDVIFQEINFLNYHQGTQSRRFVQKKYACLRNFSSVQAHQGYNLKKGARTITIDSKMSIFMDGQTNLDQAISQIKQYEGISQFIKANLFVADSIAVVGDVIQSPYLLANLLQKVTGNGQIYFFNPSGAFQTYIQKMIELNEWETVYEFMVFEEIDRELTTMIELNEFSVMMITVDALSKIYDIAQRLQGLLILLKFDGYSQQLVSTLKKFDEYDKYMISSTQSKKYKYNLCLNYAISNSRETFFTKETFEHGGWIGIVI